MIPNHQDSLRDSEYLSAVLPQQPPHVQSPKHAASSAHKFRPPAYVFDVKARNNKSELLPRKNSTVFKKCMLTAKYSETTPKKVKMTPFQDRKSREKQASDKKVAAACLTEQSEEQLQASRSNWLIIREMERPSSEGKSLQQEIKRIKEGI
jgi:hypothetical protein